MELYLFKHIARSLKSKRGMSIFYSSTNINFLLRICQQNVSDENIVRIDIIDKGKGIGKTEKEHIFERLYTADNTRNKEVPGNGLGLTIAKELAEKIGGNITLESEPYIRTIFTLELDRMEY
ncbi:ATP-binding protein [Anaerocolumna sp. MB42-C2]|uniref:ATP-binding protein n=1 Tax=Anaerocolumna sp. MB42-C2 TaxID=3070997 RepID=UPI0027DFE517|nr:ATP-binding protein [Anaerocolumna sp. MB42-C2]WMJ87482.1 ATP-binding protein [Anaerocolumna sp. MB42-C2]